MSLRAGGTVSLSGPLALQGRDAAAGLREWSSASGIPLTLEDDHGQPERVRAFYAEAAGELDIVLGPYGSGLTRAAIATLAGTGIVVWNHGGAAISRPTSARVVDVLAPAERYWTGLAPTLTAAGIDVDRVVIARGDTPFGRSIAEGARQSLAESGAEPLAVRDLDPEAAESVALDATRLGASAVAGGATLEADLRLAAQCHERGLPVALVGLGIAEAGERLGDRAIGAIGPAQWLPGAPGAGAAPPGVTDYPGAQAFAAGQIAERVIAAAGTAAGDLVWDAARQLATTTLLGPFQVDVDGRQVAHAPLLLRWASTGAGPRREPVWSAALGVRRAGRR